MRQSFTTFNARFVPSLGWRVCAQWQPGTPVMAYSAEEAESLAEDAARRGDQSLSDALRDALLDVGRREKAMRRTLTGILPESRSWNQEASRIARSNPFDFERAVALVSQIRLTATQSLLRDCAELAFPSLVRATEAETDDFRRNVAKTRFNALRHLLRGLS